MSESAAIAAGQALSESSNAKQMAEEAKGTAESAEQQLRWHEEWDAEVSRATQAELDSLRARLDACELEGRISRAHVKALIAHLEELETEPVPAQTTKTETVIEGPKGDEKPKGDADKDEKKTETVSELREVRGWW